MSKGSNLVVEFRKIPSLKFLYEVSEDGRTVRNVKSKHQLAMDQDRGGYYRVSPFIDGKQIHRFVHILVAECWLGPKPEGMECDHIDRNIHNNHYTNLRYVTRSENHENRVFSEEGRRRNGDITYNRYISATPEQQQEIIGPMLEAARLPENREKARKALIEATGHPVILIKDGERFELESKKQAARFLSEQTGSKLGTMEHYIHQKRKYIHGYRVIYVKKAFKPKSVYRNRQRRRKQELGQCSNEPIFTT